VKGRAMAESNKKPDGNTKGDDVFDIDRIRKLIELMKEHELGEIDLRQENQRIRLCGLGHGQPILAGQLMAPAAVPTAAAPVAAAPSAAAPAADNLDGPHIAIIRSPMVGTFYSKPNPTSKDFVEVGASVQNDTVICIIEAMKVFNEIPAEMRGKVVQVLARNEEAIDFGKPLFKIDTRG
jgi:acetyl-CoA carboxylase biotin carboxyl carrier protein